MGFVIVVVLSVVAIYLAFKSPIRGETLTVNDMEFWSNDELRG